MNQRGYSLAEIMIAVGISAIVILGVSNLIVTFNSEVKAVSETLDFDEEAYRLQYYFSLPLRNVVNVRVSDTSIDSYAIPSTGATAYEGRVLHSFDSKDHANSNTITTALLLGARDVSHLDVNSGKSDFKGVGIYFQQPSATTFGVLYIYTQGGDLKPSRSGQFITNITRLQIDTVEVAGQIAKSLTVNVWMRFPTSASPLDINWCPTLNPCGVGAPAKDIQRTFTINLNNNIDAASPAVLPFGRVYFLGRGNL